MVDYKFYLDGVSSLDYGIILQAPMTFGQPVPKVTTQSVPGRNGDLHIWDGSYSNIDGTARCYALDIDDVSIKLNGIHLFLGGSSMGYRRLETDEEPNIYRLARVINLPETEIRMRRLSPFSISFDCDPRKFVKEGELDQEITSSTNLYNPWGESHPLIHVYGSGNGNFQIGAYSVAIKGMSNDLYLHTGIQDAYTVNSGGAQASANNLVSWNECPKLIAGSNQVSFSGGITKLVITPRWCFI